MPILEWECQHCEKIFEKICLSEDEISAIIECSSCSSKDIKRIMSSTTFKLKGSGWSADGTMDPNSDEYLIKNGPEKTLDAFKKTIPS